MSNINSNNNTLKESFTQKWKFSEQYLRSSKM